MGPARPRRRRRSRAILPAGNADRRARVDRDEPDRGPAGLRRAAAGIKLGAAAGGCPGTAGFFISLTVKMVALGLAFGAVGIAAMIYWGWTNDRGPTVEPGDVGAGLKLPVYMTGPRSHSWWAMISLILIVAMIFSSTVLSYLYLWLVNPGAWPPENVTLPAFDRPGLSGLVYLASSGLMVLAGILVRRLAQGLVGLLLVHMFPRLLGAE